MPERAAPLSRRVQGESAKKYLVDSGLAHEQQAAELWQIRQLVHGKDVSAHAEIERVAGYANRLRAIVLQGLKEALGLPADHRPAFVPAEGPVVGPFRLGGHRDITPTDVYLDDEQSAFVAR